MVFKSSNYCISMRLIIMLFKLLDLVCFCLLIDIIVSKSYLNPSLNYDLLHFEVY